MQQYQPQASTAAAAVEQELLGFRECSLLPVWGATGPDCTSPTVSRPGQQAALPTSTHAESLLHENSEHCPISIWGSGALSRQLMSSSRHSAEDGQGGRLSGTATQVVHQQQQQQAAQTALQAPSQLGTCTAASEDERGDGVQGQPQQQQQLYTFPQSEMFWSRAIPTQQSPGALLCQPQQDPQREHQQQQQQQQQACQQTGNMTSQPQQQQQALVMRLPAYRTLLNSVIGTAAAGHAPAASKLAKQASGVGCSSVSAAPPVSALAALQRALVEDFVLYEEASAARQHVVGILVAIEQGDVAAGQRLMAQAAARSSVLQLRPCSRPRSRLAASMGPSASTAAGAGVGSGF